MARSKGKGTALARRSYSPELKQEAVRMVLDGHSAISVAQRLGIVPNALYRCKQATV